MISGYPKHNFFSRKKIPKHAKISVIFDNCQIKQKYGYFGTFWTISRSLIVMLDYSTGIFQNNSFISLFLYQCLSCDFLVVFLPSIEIFNVIHRPKYVKKIRDENSARICVLDCESINESLNVTIIKSNGYIERG